MTNNATTLNFGTTVTLAEAASLIINCPDTKFLIRGPRGIGKSSMMGVFEKHFGDAYEYAYFDCAGKDLGDAGLPAINHEKQTSEFYVNTLFKMHTGKPVIIMLDEIGKGMAPVQTMLNSLLEARNARMGGTLLAKGSRVFATSNLLAEGLGDNLKAHTLDRMTEIEVRTPTADEWLAWAVDNEMDGVVMAWVKQFPACLASYRDGITEYKANPYVPQFSGVNQRGTTPRSLARASDIIRNRKNFTDNALTCALKGTFGEAAARDMQAFIQFQDQLPTWESIMSNPKGVPVPEGAGACAVLVFGAVQRVDTNSLEVFMDYIERFEPEWQATFCITLAKSIKRDVAFKSKTFAAWILKNEDLL